MTPSFITALGLAALKEAKREPIEPGHKTIINELEDVQLQIAKLWNVATELRRDFDESKLDYSNYKRVNAERLTELQKDVDGLKVVWRFANV